MIRLYVFGEGETEEAVVNLVLAPHLAARNVFAFARSLGGRSRWERWRHFMDRQMKQERGDAVRFTTIFDLYRLPKDFPECAALQVLSDTDQRANRLEQAMRADLDHRFLIPYIQRHEIEALVLASLDELETRLPHARAGIATLRKDIGGQGPEDVNDGTETHPSKRLERCVPGYGKTADGPAVIQQAGLDRVRAACPRFHAWVTTLESLAEPVTP